MSSFSSYAVAYTGGCRLSGAPVLPSGGGLLAILDHEIFAGPCGQAIAGATFVSELPALPDLACVRSKSSGDLAELSGIAIENGRLRYRAAGSGSFCPGGALTPDGGAPSGAPGGGGGGCSTTSGGGTAAALLLLLVLAGVAGRRRRVRE